MALEVGPDRVGVGTVDINLLENGEGDSVIELAEGLNLILCARLLVGKLVAGEAEDDETLVGILLVELLEALVLGGEAALGGDVDNEDYLAFELGKIVGHGGLVEGLEFIEFGHVGCIVCVNC